MLPLSTQSHIIALLPSNEKSFTLYDGFGKSALLWSFEPKHISGKKFTYVVFKKCLVYKANFSAGFILGRFLNDFGDQNDYRTILVGAPIFGRF